MEENPKFHSLLGQKLELEPVFQTSVCVVYNACLFYPTDSGYLQVHACKAVSLWRVCVYVYMYVYGHACTNICIHENVLYKQLCPLESWAQMSALVGVFTYYYNSGSWEGANGIQTSNLRRFNRTIYKDGGNWQEKVKLPRL